MSPERMVKMRKNELVLLPEKFSSCRVAVLGDLMLDVYLWGQVTRISPEAPVPVINVRKRTSCLGGAANVMRNIASLGGKVFAFGALGCDASGKEIREKMREIGIDDSMVVDIPDRCTTEKRRVVSGQQQLLRVDYEETSEIDADTRRKIIAPLLKMIAAHQIDAVIFEDYAKGLLGHDMVEEVAAAAAKNGIVTALDPKPGKLAPVKGITVIKPNRSEAFAMANIPESAARGAAGNDADLKTVAGRLMQIWEPEQLLISLASQGMALFSSRGGDPEIIPTQAREVYDVSGAGDTVIATYTLALISGATPAEAAMFANLAAGVVVGKIGTAPILKAELVAELNR